LPHSKADIWIEQQASRLVVSSADAMTYVPRLSIFNEGVLLEISASLLLADGRQCWVITSRLDLMSAELPKNDIQVLRLVN